MSLDVLEAANSHLPAVLQHLVWEYAEPLYTCHNCQKEVAWSTIMEWGRGKDPDHPEHLSKRMYCQDACLLCIVHGWCRHGRCGLIDGMCLPCFFREGWRQGDNAFCLWSVTRAFYAWPTTPCLRPDKCRGTPHAVSPRDRGAEAAP